MASNDFVALLGDEEVRASIESWAHNREGGISEQHRVAWELVLGALLRRATDGDPDGNQETLRSEVDQRLQASPLFSPGPGLKAIGNVDEMINNASDFSSAM